MFRCTDLLQPSTVDLDYRSVVLEHTYAEGIDFTVTDLVLYPCINYLLVSITINHFSSTGRCTGHRAVTLYFQNIIITFLFEQSRQARTPAIVTSSFKLVLTHTFTLCGVTCYILSS